jgi:hypothetical protein
VPEFTDATPSGRPDGWHDGRHDGTVEEWVFSAWDPRSTTGVLSGHRIVGRTAWYWASLARADGPLLHVTDFDVPVRSDPFVVKGEALWAEHHCVAEAEQWSVGNETYASAITDPDDALGRAYGVPTPIAFDLEWYAIEEPKPLPQTDVEGYTQRGVVHGTVEVLGEPRVEFVEVPAHRWHRWSLPAPAPPSTWPPVPLPTVTAHTGVRSPFAFPDGSVADLVLTAEGWARRAPGRLTPPV